MIFKSILFIIDSYFKDNNTIIKNYKDFIFTSTLKNNIIDSSNNIVDSSHNVIDPSNNIIDSSNNIIDSSNNIIDSSNNIIDSSNNIVDSSDNKVEPYLKLSLHQPDYTFERVYRILEYSLSMNDNTDYLIIFDSLNNRDLKVVKGDIISVNLKVNDKWIPLYQF